MFLQKLNWDEDLNLRIVSTISLEEVPYTHFKLERNNVKGVITVDPWQE